MRRKKWMELLYAPATVGKNHAAARETIRLVWGITSQKIPGYVKSALGMPLHASKASVAGDEGKAVWMNVQ